ncbi:LysR family transcriptional regulator [Parahaliea mediterranea]|uniref:LysR family transcriptional regulator n=1 Tax=Parahaliea mediterranea TaxID=651086 RepID=UPI000E2F82AC|nr:LysR family transcriptional regulator [Parahaliea mediterranea]
MNVSIKQLRAFLALAEYGSFAEASESLHLSQPALSAAIRNMEQAVGGKLFNRTTRHLALTPEGRQFLPVARQLQAEWDRAFDDLSRRFALLQGHLRLAAMPSFAINCLPPLLQRFRQQYPGINLVIDDIVMELVLDAVRDGRAELGVTFEPEQYDGLHFTPLFEDRFIAIVPAGSPLASCQRIHWQQLAEQPFITMNRGSWMRATTDRVMAALALHPASLAEASQLATIGRMVASGLGVSIAPALCQTSMQLQGVQCRPLEGPVIQRQVGVFTRKRHPLSGPAEALHQLLCRHYG